MGRPTKPKREHSTTVSVSLRKALVSRIEECREISGKSRSEFIASIIENNLFSDKAYASYMYRQKQLETAYWEWQFKKADGKAKLEQDQTQVADY